MSDEYVAGRPDAGPRSGHPNRTGLVAGAAVGLVICAVVGAVGGFLLAGGGEEPTDQGAGSVPTATSTATPSTPRSTPGRTPTRRSTTAPAPQIGEMQLPNLVGMDFEEARAELLRRGLGAQITFGKAGSDRSVASTNPRAGTSVRKGVTVRLTVVGAPPEVVVPELVGQSCAQAARRLVEDGLYPSYPTDRHGQVRSQDPKGGATLRWNERVKLFCSDSAGPTSTPTL
ncbi:PASTA domain-containing protein [Plantactinospora sp. S1510]|uniref:PASTA domain-containing protein n=1 Tax=Plantactinospora alkalitolerans TaxID=2789879 RepID=A0ABS0GQS6_9ACTN|nr:PASTA domain-containing protein [Plantactinospora alkalitolerans]MBF9128262.1 PASTA domain-containing protein [Plantactinospora alkalitolerans]